MNYYDDYDYEPPPEPREVENATHRARKKHFCTHCEGIIQPGQRYKKTVYFNDGESFDEPPASGEWPYVVFKTHCDRDQCAAARADRQAQIAHHAPDAPQFDPECPEDYDPFWDE